ncbi:efflux RND transporter periplasmic adaptor subunit [Colwellia sp. BRX8-4]|uniref:efflux RND transporter periplasmic adaptor subunit n=1 Tax=Colwellia sp. BRX8-4 TaxID=2759836 RepID=UPI0015F75FD9|nr:efflux RND transporter periplasmic adaptor subunit [Colwellia sp. BRX8-4]MBA6363536.1 efflux RND transporter periplasmic adaptor subunit [Colwellia sp. BRX8-8]MBA6370900.1 efflux RND transporter periplasmic adaptor subunit [Colwellia sp. BRX8-4]
MPITRKTPFELSELTIDRSPQTKAAGLSGNYTSILIVTLLSTSLYFVGQTLFFPTSAAEIINHLETDNKRVNESVNVDIKQHFPTTHDVNTAEPINNSVLDASGHVVARRIATVSSRVTGKLNRLNIEEGQRVSKSEILAELDDKQASISYQLALTELSAKQAGFDEFTLLFKQQNQRFKRDQTLASKKLISEQLLEDSAFKNAQLAIQIRHKKAMVDSAKQRVELAQYQLNQHKIRAPFDGVVISKNAQVGELISAGSSGGGFIRTGVGTIVDMSSLEIEVEVGESYINRVYPGQKVFARLDAYPQWSISSEVVAVIPTADRQKASIKVRVKLLTADPRILPDMGVKVSFMKNDQRSLDVFPSSSNNHVDIAAL